MARSPTDYQDLSSWSNPLPKHSPRSPCPGERQDAGVTEVQAQLGHSSLAVTTVYLAHLDARQLAEAMEEV